MSAGANHAQRMIAFAGCDRDFNDTPRGQGLAKLLYLKALRSWVKPGSYAWWRLCDDIETAQRSLAKARGDLVDPLEQVRS